MRYLHGKLKVKKGGVIHVTVSKSTRVLILNDREYKKYKDNMTFTYYGGQKDGSYDFDVPKSGTWHVVVEKGTHSKPLDVSSNVSVTHPVPVKRKPARALAHSLAEADEQLDAEGNDAAADDEESDEEKVD